MNQYQTIKNELFDDKEKNGASYIGIKKNEDGYSVILPYGFNLPQRVSLFDRENIEKIKCFARCINKALAKNKVRESLIDEMGGQSPLAGLLITNDYVKNGTYIEFEPEYIRSTKGRMDCKRTIQQCSPIISNDEAFYQPYVTRRKNVKSNELVALVQGNVINDFMDNGGEILFGYVVHVPVKKILLDSNLVLRLKKEKALSFNSRKQQLIQWMIDYINGAISSKIHGSWQFAIKASTLWEEMVDACLGNQRPRNKTQYGAQYAFVDEKGIYRGSSPLSQHDTIYETEDCVFILDAKMYMNRESLMFNSILDKQVGYYTAAQNRQKSKRIINVFVKPYVAEMDSSVGYLGRFRNLDELTDKNKYVMLYSIEFEKLLKAYYLDKTLGQSFFEDIVSHAKEGTYY